MEASARDAWEATYSWNRLVKRRDKKNDLGTWFSNNGKSYEKLRKTIDHVPEVETRLAIRRHTDKIVWGED